MNFDFLNTRNRFFFISNWFTNSFSWTNFSREALSNVEKLIFSYLKTPYLGRYITIGPTVGHDDKIWTISLNITAQNKVPILLLHGLGAGVAFWCQNLDSFAKHRPVYAIDILGFGRSSRSKFSNNAQQIEKQFIESIENWRKQMQLDNMIILGHSLGGYIATAYALNYPNRVKKLILLEPWGFPEIPTREVIDNQAYFLRVLYATLKPFNPIWFVRFAGPYAKQLINYIRPDLPKKFGKFLLQDQDAIVDYLHQCNAQKPTGENAYNDLMINYGWAKNPMAKRIHLLHPKIPMVIIYGNRSWVDNLAIVTVVEKRINGPICFHEINIAGHHLYAEKPEIFNEIVNQECSKID